MQKSFQLYFSIYQLLIVFLYSSYKENPEKSADFIDGVWESLDYGRLVLIEAGEYLLADVALLSYDPISNGKITKIEGVAKVPKKLKD